MKGDNAVKDTGYRTTYRDEKMDFRDRRKKWPLEDPLLGLKYRSKLFRIKYFRIFKESIRKY